MRKICVVTGTRAEYGLLKPVIKRINDDNELQLQLIVTGMHLSPEFGLTYKEIINDGFEITEKVEMLLSSDTSIGISKSTGLALISFAEVFERLKPDIIVILGDRYEMLAVAISAMFSNIPIAHLHGGEATEGSIDEAIRHSITKMSYIHFTSTEVYRNRVIQLGEDPNRVFNVGSTSVEIINNLKLLNKEELENEINMKLDGKIALLTFHPTTLECCLEEKQFLEILKALDYFKEIKIIFTKANSDKNGRIINQMIDKYVEENNDRCKAFTSMGQLRYLSAMKYCDFVIGNSSSGVLEAPIFNKPTINIGDRQKGRLQMKSIVNCNATKEQVIKSIKKVTNKQFINNIKNNYNPYGDGKTSYYIINIIKGYLFNKKINLKKSFYDIDWRK